VRDQIVDFVRRWAEKAGIGAGRSSSGSASKPASSMTGGSDTDRPMSTNGWFPGLLAGAVGEGAIVDFHLQNPLEVTGG